MAESKSGGTLNAINAHSEFAGGSDLNSINRLPGNSEWKVRPRAERWHILEPFIPEEVMTSFHAAKRAGKKPRTIQNWAEAYGIGRKIIGQWHISRVALEMLLESNEGALARYLSGDREDATVTEYFAKLKVPLPKK